jgi:hypothetical protein
MMGGEEVVGMRNLIRAGLVLTVSAVLCLAGSPAAGAQGEDEQGDTVIVLTGRAEIRDGETVDNVFIADGPVVVDGTVRNGLIALNGDVLVRGVVEADVVALDGRVVVAGSGEVQGDVVSRHRPILQGDGSLGGEWERWDPRAWSRGWAIFTRIAIWFAFTVSTLALGLILGLLAPRAAAAVHATARERIGPVIGWGLLLTIGLPVAAVLAMATVVGLPLGLGTLLALGLVYGIGYTAAAWVLGRTLTPRAHPILSFLAGWAVLRVVALVPVLGGLTWFAAVVVGLGAIAVAAYRARRRAAVSAAEAPVGPPPVGPPPADTPS